MKIAEAIYNRSKEEGIELTAKKMAIKHETGEIKTVTYQEYTFKDGSRITFGSNGYISAEYEP